MNEPYSTSNKYRANERYRKKTARSVNKYHCKLDKDTSLCGAPKLKYGYNLTKTTGKVTCYFCKLKIKKGEHKA